MKNMKKVICALLAGVMVLGMLSGCGAKSEETTEENKEENTEETTEAEPIAIKISAINTVTWAPVFIAQTQGFFEAEGMEVEFTTPGGPKGFQAMHAGDCEFCMLSQEPLLVAQEQGMESKVIAPMLDSRIYGIIAKPEITDLTQLKGLTIYASDPGSAPYVFVCNALTAAGVDPLNDVEMIQFADGNAGMESFIKGEVDAAFVNMSNLPALGEFDYNIIADTTDPEQCEKYLGSAEFPGEMLCTTAAYAEENPEICQKVVNAIQEAQKWIADSTDDEVAEALYSIFGSLDKDVIAAEVALVRDKFSKTGVITEEGQAAVIDMCKNAGLISEDIPYEDVIDMEFIEAYNK